MDSSKLLEMLQVIEKENFRIRSIIIIKKNGRRSLKTISILITEIHWQDIKSVSKSFLSVLTGIAIEEKRIRNIDQTLQSFLPEYFSSEMDPRKKSITLHHLLTMTTGLNIRENSKDMEKIFEQKQDWIKNVLSHSMSEEPGSRFNYMTPSSHIMSVILTKSVGMTLLEYANQRLFEPLGIKRMLWSKSPTGYYFGGAEMFFRPLDMAKLGMLILQDGKWDDKRIVPSGWIHDSYSRPYCR